METKSNIKHIFLNWKGDVSIYKKVNIIDYLNEINKILWIYKTSSESFNIVDTLLEEMSNCYILILDIIIIINKIDKSLESSI